MVSYETFEQDNSCLIEYLKKVFTENQGELPFPARMCGATVSNFKSLQQVRCPSRKINNIFTKIGEDQSTYK